MAISNALCDSFRIIAKHDYPGNWPTMCDQLHGFLASGDAAATVTALRMLRQYVRHFDVKLLSLGGEPLGRVASALMPTVFGIVQTLVEHERSLEAALAIVECLKIYSSVIRSNATVMEYTCNEDTLTSWAAVADAVLKIPLPDPGQEGLPSGQPSDPEERSRWPWWKAKKWALKVCFRLSNIQLTPPPEEKEQLNEQGLARRTSFVQGIRRIIAPHMVESAVAMLSAHTRGELWLPDKVKLYCIRVLTVCSDFGAVWAPLKQHLHALIGDICLGLLRLTPADAELLEEDPHAYLNAQHNDILMYDDYRSAVDSYLYTLVSTRPKTVLPVVEEVIAGVFTSYDAAPAGSKDEVGKEAALRIFGLLNSLWRRKKAVRAQLHGMLVSHVTTELRGSTAFLRVRAIHTWSVYSDSNSVGEDAKMEALAAVLDCLTDQSLPIRFSAATSLASFLTAFESARTMVAPHAIELMQVLFSMLEEVGIDQVVNTISTVVGSFQDQLPSIAAELAAKLSEIFLRIMKNLLESEDEMLDSTAEAVLSLMYDVVSMLNNWDTPEEEAVMKPALLNGVLPHLWPMLGVVFDEEEAGSLEYFSLGCEIVNEVIAALGEEGVATESTLWQLLVRMMKMVTDPVAIDYAPDLCAPLCTMVAFAPHKLQGIDPVTGFDYLELIVGMARLADRAEDDSRLYVSKLIVAVLHFGRGLCDRGFHPIVHMHARMLAEARTPEATVGASVALGMCLQYNPAETLAALAAHPEAGDVTEATLSSLEVASTELVKAVDIKVVLVGWGSLLSSLADGMLPTLDLSHLPRILTVVVGLLQQEQQALEVIEVAKAKEEAAAIADRDSDSDAEAETNEAEKTIFRRRGLVSNAKPSGAGTGGTAGGDDDEEDDSIPDGDIDAQDPDPYEDMDTDASTPLDHINSLLFIEEAIRKLMASDIAASIQGSIPPEVSGAIPYLLAAASEKRAAGVVAGHLGPE
jgi:hypothetical protein